MSFARSRGAVLHWRADGPAEAPPVVFANSLGSELQIWDAVAERLVGRWHVVRYDMRGHGLSDLPDGGAGIAEHAADLAGLLDAIGVARCAVVGLSVGGMVALALAAMQPERVRSLALCDTATRIGTRETWDSRIAAVQSGGMAAIADGVIERWFAPGFRAREPEAWQGWRTMLLRTPAEGYASVCAAIRDADLRAQASALRVPCLCLVGAEDASTPPDLVRGTAEAIPGARFVVVRDAGHLPCIEQPDEVARLLAEHLEQAGHG